jgi:hypothetical protein
MACVTRSTRANDPDAGRLKPLGTPTSLSGKRTWMIAAIAVVILALAGGSLWYAFLREEQPQGHTDQVTLVAPAVDGPLHATDPVLLTSLVMTGGEPDNAAFEISLMAPDGAFLPMDGAYALTAEITNLNDGAHVDAMPLEEVAGSSTPTWRVDDPGIDTEGWWRIRTTTERPDGDPVTAEFHLLMPDPNMTGFTSPPAPDSDPEAEATLGTALTQMSEWDSLRWWEWLSAGDGSIILVEFSVTTPDANGQPDGFRNRSIYAGRMVPGENGEPPSPPRMDWYTSVTIGDDAWAVREDGTPEPASATRYLPIQHYPETYEGATSVTYGITEEVFGREAQVVTFHVPTLPTQSEAWYAFWIDIETGEVLQLSMLAMNHYMVWEYFDVNEPFVLEFPQGVPAATPQASPTE